MKYFPCQDCTIDKGGCDYKITEIANGLYRCDYSKQVFSSNDKSFATYFSEIDERYKDFCKKHNKWLYYLDQHHISKTLTEEDERVYRVLDAFVAAKSNFVKEIPTTLELNILLARRNAYTLITKFEEIKKIKV